MKYAIPDRSVCALAPFDVRMIVLTAPQSLPAAYTTWFIRLSLVAI